MTDISGTIIAKSDQINADDLIGGPATITVDRAVVKQGQDQPLDLHTVETPGRAYRPSKTMRRLIAEAWGLDSAVYAGRSMTIYRNPDITFGKDKVGGIEISAMSHIDGPLTVALTAGRGRKKQFTVQPLQQPSQQAPDVDALIAKADGDPEKLQQLFDWAVEQGAPGEVLNRISALLTSSEEPDLGGDAA